MILREIERIKLILKEEVTNILDARDENIVYTPQDFPSYMIVRRNGPITKKVDMSDLNSNLVFANDLNLQLSVNTLLCDDGWFIIPLAPNLTEGRYIKVVDKETLILEDEPIFVTQKPIVNDKINQWIDYPMNIANTILLEETKYIAQAAFSCGVYSKTDSYTIRVILNNLEVVQKVRISMGNTIRNSMFRQLGKKRFDELKKQHGEYLNALMEEYNRLKKGFVNKEGKMLTLTKKKFVGTSLIPTFMVYRMLSSYDNILRSEKELVSALKDAVHEHKYWIHHAEGIKGLGEIITAHLIANLDPYKARHPSAFIRYCGMDVQYNEETGRYEGTNKKHTREIPYLDINGEVSVTKTLGYNVKLKAKIMGVLFSSFLKNKDCYYRKIYDDSKYYYSNRSDLKKRWEEKKKGDSSSAHKMAARKAMSYFLRDWWMLCRECEGLPLNGGDYAFAKLGITHKYDVESPIAHLDINFKPYNER